MAIQYCDYDIKGTLAVAGTSTLSGIVTITEATSSPLLNIYNTSNGSGATIRFSDQTSQSQVGDITFYHSDGSSQGGGASWHFVSQPDTVLVAGSGSVNGRFVAKSAGSVGEVDYGFYDDVNTGMVRTSADNVSLVAGGVAGIAVGSTGDVTVGKDLYIPEYLYHTGDTNTYLRFQSDSIELQTGGWKVFGNTTLKYGALYGDNSLRVYATQAGGYINGTLTVDTINNATSDTDKFLVSDGDEIKYRTGAEVLADIGAGTGTVTGTGSSGQIAIFNGSSSLTSNSSFKELSTGIIYAERSFRVKGVGGADFSSASDDDTGLGYFDGANGVSLVSKGAKNLTVKEGTIEFDTYTSTSVATTGSLNPNQNRQAPSQDTLATLAVDPSGNVVRGEQEGTWTFTRAQLDATLGQTLIAAPGANKAIIVTESDWMVKYSATGSMSGTQTYDVRQASNTNASAIISTLPGTRINEILSASQGTPVNPSYGFCARDVPLQTRTYKTNTATTLHKASNGALPTGVISISIKLKYRIFDATTF